MHPPASVSGTTFLGTHEVACDFCVVGSGAGGAIAAATLAAGGAHVVLVEEGHHHRRRDFNMQEAWAYPALYQDHGNRATADLAILLLQGRSVGGGTTVNWGSSFRVPPRTLALWQHRHGLTLDEATLAPHYDAVEQRLSVGPGNPDDVNANNAKLWDGARALHLAPELIRRSVKGCARLGYCGMGCPLDAKQSALVTYLPDALSAGAQLFSDCRVHRLVGTRRGAEVQIEEVLAEALDPERARPTGAMLRVRPRRGVIVAAGALNTPALLMRNGFAKLPALGRRTFLHPTVPLVALFHERIEGFYGPPQSVACHHMSDRGPGHMGYFLETAPVHPMLASVAFPGFAAPHRALAASLAHAQATIALLIDGHGDDEGGTVKVSSEGRVALHYPFAPALVEAARDALVTMARIQFAAGAREVVSLHHEPLRLRNVDEVERLRAAPFAALDHTVFSAHQMGGCAMGRSPAHAVTDEDGRVFGAQNVWVMDGSLFPTSLGVNPQLTIYALAKALSERLHAAG